MEPTFTEFATVIDGTEHPHGMKRKAYEAYLAGERRVFYPLREGYYKYLVDGLRHYVARSLHDGSEEFVEHQRFTFD